MVVYPYPFQDLGKTGNSLCTATDAVFLWLTMGQLSFVYVVFIFIGTEGF